MTGLGSRLPRSLSWRLKLFSLAHKASLSTCRYNPLIYFASLAKSYSLYRKHGFLPDEARTLGLFNYGGIIQDCFISKNHLVKLQKTLNHPSFQQLTEDKALFYIRCAHIGIPIPRLLGIFFKKASGLSWGNGPLVGEGQWAGFFEKTCPDEFVVKPSNGVYGEGILFINKSNPGFSGSELFRSLDRHPQCDSFVIQEHLYNHPDIMALNPKKGLQTIRVTTFVKDAQTVEIVLAFFKPIAGENRIDNHRHGSTGNLLCPISITDGVLGDLTIVGDSGITRLDRHPDTGAVLKGQAMPHWPEISQSARSAALAFLPMRSIGWDIAVTPGGIFVIEGNSRWDPPMFGNAGGIIKAIRQQLN
jgi:hypothetical protein